MKKCVIIGAGGHAKVVIDIACQNQYEIVGLTDPNMEPGTLCMGYPVLGNDDILPKLLDENRLHLAMGIGHLGNTTVRNKIFEDALRLGFEFPVLAHDTAIINRAEIGRGTILSAGSIVNPEAKVGELCIINTASVVEHEAVVEDGVHIAPHATILGNAHIGKGSLIGAGSVVLQGVRIGCNCVIGAGSVVLHDVLDNSVVYGNPGVIHKRK